MRPTVPAAERPRADQQRRTPCTAPAMAKHSTATVLAAVTIRVRGGFSALTSAPSSRLQAAIIISPTAPPK